MIYPECGDCHALIDGARETARLARLWANRRTDPGRFTDPTDVDGLPPPPAPPRLNFLEVIALQGRAKACPNFVPRISCCDGDSCLLDPNGRGWVDVMADCRTCPLLPSEAP